MITNVHIAINRHLQSVTVDRYHTESYVDGELTPVYVTGVSVDVAVFPIGRRDLDFFPEGTYTFQDKKFYQVTSGTITDKSIITVGDDRYKVDGGTIRIFEGGYVTYFGKRISDSDDTY